MTVAPNFLAASVEPRPLEPGPCTTIVLPGPASALFARPLHAVANWQSQRGLVSRHSLGQLVKHHIRRKVEVLPETAVEPAGAGVVVRVGHPAMPELADAAPLAVPAWKVLLQRHELALFDAVALQETLAGFHDHPCVLVRVHPRGRTPPASRAREVAVGSAHTSRLDLHQGAVVVDIGNVYLLYLCLSGLNLDCRERRIHSILLRLPVWPN